MTAKRRILNAESGPANQAQARADLLSVDGARIAHDFCTLPLVSFCLLPPHWASVSLQIRLYVRTLLDHVRLRYGGTRGQNTNRFVPLARCNFTGRGSGPVMSGNQFNRHEVRGSSPSTMTSIRLELSLGPGKKEKLRTRHALGEGPPGRSRGRLYNGDASGCIGAAARSNVLPTWTCCSVIVAGCTPTARTVASNPEWTSDAASSAKRRSGAA